MPRPHRLHAFVAVACASLALVGLQPLSAAADPAPAAPLGPITVHHKQAARTPCRAGLVALTFDDGPRPGTTPRLVRELRALHVPATFFEMGNHITAYPGLVRLVDRSGFAIANHSWDHPTLPYLRSPRVRWEIRSTTRALRRLGVTPAPLMRPPYGALTPRVRRIIDSLHLIPTLWTIDSDDWRGGNFAQIAGRILRALRPHQENVVLQHDGVTNSPASVRAVPVVVRRARARGYCFTGLGRYGHPHRATPSVAVTSRYRQRAAGDTVTLRITPTSAILRPASLHLSTADLTAVAGADYRRVDRTIRLRPGTERVTVTIPVSDATGAIAAQRFRVRLSSPHGVELTARTIDVRIGIGVIGRPVAPPDTHSPAQKSRHTKSRHDKTPHQKAHHKKARHTHPAKRSRARSTS